MSCVLGWPDMYTNVSHRRTTPLPFELNGPYLTTILAGVAGVVLVTLRSEQSSVLPSFTEKVPWTAMAGFGVAQVRVPSDSRKAR